MAVSDRIALGVDEAPEVVVPPQVGGSPSFGLAARLAVDSGGNIYIADILDANVKVFDENGTLVRSFGRRGQGPTEFSRHIRAIAVAGEMVAVSDLGHRRLSVWTTSGEFVKSIPVRLSGRIPGTIGGFWELAGFSDGTVAGIYTETDSSQSESERYRISVVDLKSETATLLADVPRRGAYAMVGGRRVSMPMLGPEPQLAADESGRIYASTMETYQVTAYDRVREAWSLVVAWPRQDMPEAEYDRAVDVLGSIPGGGGRVLHIDRSDVIAPTKLPALSTLRVDDVGRLYVFPLVYYRLGQPNTLPEHLPVDVYSPDGRLLAAGLLPARFGLHRDQSGSWLASHEGFIYGLERDALTNDQQIVRYRLPSLPAPQ